MQYRKPRMDVARREARRVEAVRRLRTGEPAPAIAADLGMAPNTVYAPGKKAREQGFKSLKSVPKSWSPRYRRCVTSPSAGARGRPRRAILTRAEYHSSASRIR
ncbi:MAG: helix-turn-helix domain-containing protein [Phycisphaerales bacterium]|nr:helix-turn-helix domain-containing protein [Phycisphaerales bacterium]